jgi:hypothetical protein
MRIMEDVTMFQVLGLRKVPNTDPQEYELWLKDKENTKPGYIGRTENGTETEVRAMLKDTGATESDINKLFRQAA